MVLNCWVGKACEVAKKLLEGVYHQASGTLTSWQLHHKKIKVHQYQGEKSLSLWYCSDSSTSY